MYKILLIVLLSLSGGINAKNIGSGNWLLTQVIQNNKTIEVYTLMDFLDNGNIEMMGIKFGTWTYHQKSKKFNILSSNLKELNGESTVIKINNNELILEKKGVTIYFIKLDLEKIIQENSNSGLIGTWQFKDDTNADVIKLVTFKAPDVFTYVEKGSDMESRTSGTWMYNKTENTLLILGRMESMKGKNKILHIDTTKIELRNKNIILKANKIEQNINKIEKLNFKEEDFFSKSGEYIYEEEEQKLPWKDTYQMLKELENVHQLIYNYSTLIEDTGVFDTKPLTANVKVNLEEQTLEIDFIFFGYDKYNLPEDAALPPNIHEVSNINNLFYPNEEQNTFRVVETEKITTPAGTFNCKVIEVIVDSDFKKKMWMITDKPGIYAKIIEDKSGDFGHFIIYELKEIK